MVRDAFHSAGSSVQSGRVHSGIPEDATTWIDRAIVELDVSLVRDGWFGPAHTVYNEVISVLRTRLVALSVRAHQLG
jgi:hypothetical protein